MFRRSLLPCACFGAALGLATIASTMPACGQDRTTQERLDRLERDLNMLQRQVYRGGPAPMPGGDPGAAMNSELRMDRVESQMRDLTGRVEEFMNQVERLRQRVEQVNGDGDARLGQAPPPPGGYAVASPPPPPSRSRPLGISGREPPPEPPGIADGVLMSPGASPPTSLMPPGALMPPPDGPTSVAGTLTPPGVSAPPRELASAAPPSPTVRPLPNGSTSAQYNQAFGLLKQADYPAAETALKAFIEQHPNDPMAGNAQYWLGETYYTRGRYADAATAFAEGYKRYPKSTKAADELLKLGMSLARANQKQNACVALGQLDHDFPAPGTAIRDRAMAEKKRLGC